MAAKQPIWTRPAQDHLKGITEELDVNIRRIAVRIVRHEGGESVDCRHVDLATDCLKRVGLSLRPWYKRPELEVGIGSAIASSSFAMPDLSGLAVWLMGLDTTLQPLVSLLLMVFVVILGLVVVMHGWLRATV